MGDKLKGKKEDSLTTLETEKDYDGVVFTFVDEEIKQLPSSLVIADGREYYGKMVTELLANTGRLRGKKIFREDADYFSKKSDKRLLELAWDARLKNIILMDTTGGHLHIGMETMNATLIRDDSEVFVPFLAGSMGAIIFAETAKRHVAPNTKVFWHNSKYALSLDQSTQVSAIQKQFEISLLYFIQNTEKALLPIVWERIAKAKNDTNNLDNKFSFIGSELLIFGLADNIHHGANNMLEAVKTTTGVDHELVTEFFEVAEETNHILVHTDKQRLETMTFDDLKNLIKESRNISKHSLIK